MFNDSPVSVVWPAVLSYIYCSFLSSMCQLNWNVLNCMKFCTGQQTRTHRPDFPNSCIQCTYMNVHTGSSLKPKLLKATNLNITVYVSWCHSVGFLKCEAVYPTDDIGPYVMRVEYVIVSRNVSINADDDDDDGDDDDDDGNSKYRLWQQYDKTHCISMPNTGKEIVCKET